MNMHMQPVTAILLVVAIIAVVITAGCTTAYPTQTVTVTEKFIKNPSPYDPPYDWFEQHFVVDQDGLALRVSSPSPSQEAAMYTSMQKGHTYICEISRCKDGSNHYCITEIVQEV